MNRLILLLSLCYTTTYSQSIFYHYIGLECIENRFLIIEDDYKLYVIKFGVDTITMFFTKVELDKGHMWYCENFPLLELVIIKEGDEIKILEFYDMRKKEFLKYYKKSKRG